MFKIVHLTKQMKEKQTQRHSKQTVPYERGRQQMK